MRQTLTVKKERALLVAAIPKSSRDRDDLVELTALAESAGAIVVDRFQQKIDKIKPSTYIGRGKVEQLAERVKRFKVNVAIFDNDLSPAQIRELESILGVKVIDRSELILDIFATRAKTKQAKLQVELAQLEYTYPRLTRMWGHLDTLAGAGGATAAGAVGSIGTRGPGEMQLEIDRRLVSRRIIELKREIANIDKRKLREIGGRRDLFKICIVGYTNVGKSTLLNKLTNADALVEDRLFATLDTRTRKWDIGGGAEVLLSDTVGFVKNLPHQLVASFKATLEEAVNADLLLHVVDASSADALKQIESVNTVLGEIGCDKSLILQVLNKVDVLTNLGMVEMLATLFPQAVSISAKTGYGIEQLTSAVAKLYKGDEVEVQVTTRQANGKVRGFLHRYGTVVSEAYSNGYVFFEVRLGRNLVAGVRGLGAEVTEVVY